MLVALFKGDKALFNCLKQKQIQQGPESIPLFSSQWQSLFAFFQIRSLEHPRTPAAVDGVTYNAGAFLTGIVSV